VSRHDRPAIVAELHNAGASQNIIAGIVNTTRQTVAGDIKHVESERVTEGVNNLPPAGDTEPPPLDTDEAPLPFQESPSTNGEAAAGSATSFGSDGKEHTRDAAPRQTPKAKESEAVKLAQKIANLLGTATGLIDDLSGLPEDDEVELILAKPYDDLVNAMEVSGLTSAMAQDIAGP
jgi:hypothetical protein